MCVGGGEERIQKIKGWVVDGRMERLCLTFVCKAVRVCVPLHMCVLYMEGRRLSLWQTEEDCNFTGQVSVMNVWKCECKS